MTARPDLWPSLAAAIDSSEWFLFLASPEACASPWVKQELEYWLSSRDVDHLMLVLTGGEWQWDSTNNAFSDGCDAIPDVLRRTYVEEPRYVDLRWAQGVDELNLRNPLFREGVAEIAAAIRGVEKDDLEASDLREHRRTRRTVFAAACVLAVLLVVSLIAGAFAVQAARRARREAADADFDRLVELARGSGAADPALAMVLSAQAVRERDNAESQGALLAALEAEPRFRGDIVDRGESAGFTSVVANAKNAAVAGSRDGAVLFSTLHRTRLLRDWT
jgi:hypothetical protein